jgi:hypothetical protein
MDALAARRQRRDHMLADEPRAADDHDILRFHPRSRFRTCLAGAGEG